MLVARSWLNLLLTAIMTCLYKAMPKQLEMVRSPAEADTPVLAMVLL